MKVFELSKELGIDNTKLRLVASEMGYPLKHHTNKVDPDLEVLLRGHFTEATSVVEKPKKKMTSPWNSNENPWSLDMLRLKKKHEGFTPRFTTRDGLQKKLDQGWRVANAKDWGGVDAVLPGESTKDGTLVKRRELILIELPNDLAEKRSEFINWKTNQRAKEAQKVAKSKLTEAAELTDKFESHRR